MSLTLSSVESLPIPRFGTPPPDPDDWDVIGWVLLIGGLAIMAVGLIGYFYG